MKLAEANIQKALNQLNVKAVPAGHPMEAKFCETFGEHTFFLDAEGLSVIEPVGTVSEEQPTGQVVKLASWLDTKYTQLMVQEPEFTETFIVLGRAA
jgi:hypothetical protein